MSWSHLLLKRKVIGVGTIVLIGLILPLAHGFSVALANGPSYSLRFYGHGVAAPGLDRVMIQIDDPNNSDPGPPVDVGDTDFTLEFWMKAKASENTAGPISCGPLPNWISGNIVIDRDRFSQDRKFGISIAGGVVVFGVTGEGTGHRTICGTSNVLDEAWHHIAVQRRRSDGQMWLYVDGNLESQFDGPDGDISYPDDGVPNSACSPSPCTIRDPYLVFGAEKHDAGTQFPSYSGWMDEVRFSDILRYNANFTPPSVPSISDVNTRALYHFDEGPMGACTGLVQDSSGASGGPSNGMCFYGGSAPAGPVYSSDIPFTAGDVNPPIISSVVASSLDTVATITWLTDEPATSQVEFGISPTLNLSTTETIQYVTSHTVQINNLISDTTYIYRVHSRDAADNQATSGIFNFTTLRADGINWYYIPVILK